MFRGLAWTPRPKQGLLATSDSNLRALLVERALLSEAPALASQSAPAHPASALRRKQLLTWAGLLFREPATIYSWAAALCTANLASGTHALQAHFMLWPAPDRLAGAPVGWAGLKAWPAGLSTQRPQRYLWTWWLAHVAALPSFQEPWLTARKPIAASLPFLLTVTLDAVETFV